MTWIEDDNGYYFYKDDKFVAHVDENTWAIYNYIKLASGNCNSVEQGKIFAKVNLRLYGVIE